MQSLSGKTLRRQAAVVMSKERRSFDLEKRIPAPVSFMDSVGLCANAHSIQAFPYLISEEGDRVPAMLGIRLVKNTG